MWQLGHLINEFSSSLTHCFISYLQIDGPTEQKITLQHEQKAISRKTLYVQLPAAFGMHTGTVYRDWLPLIVLLLIQMPSPSQSTLAFEVDDLFSGLQNVIVLPERMIYSPSPQGGGLKGGQLHAYRVNSAHSQLPKSTALLQFCQNVKPVGDSSQTLGM